jgi:AcrR family transcriptional regulator
VSTTTGRPYGGKTPEDRALERRGRLMEAGLDLIADKGLGAATIEALCRRARLNPRYFYEHFRTRDALVLALYDATIDELREAVSVAVAEAREASPDDVRAITRAGVQAFVGVMLGDERKAWLCYVAMVGLSGEAERHRRATLRELAAMNEGLFDDFAGRGVLPRRDFSLSAVALVAAADGLLLDWVASKRRVPVEALVDELVELYAAILARHA